MGNKSGKTEITGPAKVMLEKHGEAALEGLKYWCKLGFPEMGSFSLKRLQELERRLLESEMKKKSSKLCWCAFYLWEREGQDRKKNQPGTESVESVGIFLSQFHPRCRPGPGLHRRTACESPFSSPVWQRPWSRLIRQSLPWPRRRGESPRSQRERRLACNS